MAQDNINEEIRKKLEDNRCEFSHLRNRWGEDDSVQTRRSDGKFTRNVMLHWQGGKISSVNASF